MKNYVFVFLFLILHNTCLFAQNKKAIDSLMRVYNTAKHDTSRIMALTSIAYEYRTAKPDTCIAIAQKALEMSEKIGFEKGKGRAVNRIARARLTKKQFPDAQELLDKAQTHFEKAHDLKGVVLNYKTWAFLYNLQNDKLTRIKYLEKALKTQKEIGDKKGMGETLSEIGIIYYQQNNYPLALEYLQKSLKMAEEVEDKHIISIGLNSIGSIYHNQGNYPLALEYYQKSLKIQEEIGDKEGMSMSFNNIGAIYHYQGNYPLALEYYQKSLKLEEEKGDKVAMGYSLNNIGMIYRNLDNYPLALEYYQKSIKILEEVGDKEGISANLNNMGIIYRNQGNYPLALECFQKSLEIEEGINNKLGLTYSLDGLASIAQKQQDYEKSIEYAQRSLQIAQEIKANYRIREASKTLCETYKLKGDYAKALEYHELYKQLNDSLFSVEKSKAIANLEARAEIERKDKEIEIAKKNEEVFKKDAEIQRIESERQKNANLILTKEQEADRLRNLALNEKNQRKQDSLHAKAEKIQLEADNLKINQSKLDAEKKAREVELLKEKEANELLQYIIYLVIAGLVSVFIFAFYMYRSRQKLKQANQEVQFVNEELKTANEEVKTVNETLQAALGTVQYQKDQILASINYAQRIQNAILPLHATFNLLLPQHFIFYKPRDIVSGDFYYIREIDNKIILAAVDCTGHGVPGAFMSFIGYLSLNVLTLIMRITSVSEILKEMHRGIRQVLRQKETNTYDGMDMALVSIDLENKKLAFAGAKNPLIYIQNGELHQIKGDIFGIGGEQRDMERNYTLREVDISQPTTFYLFSDGYQDQFGGSNKKKFMTKRFRELLFEIHAKPMPEQKEILGKTLQDWMMEGDKQQTDDILVIGVRV